MCFYVYSIWCWDAAISPFWDNKHCSPLWPLLSYWTCWCLCFLNTLFSNSFFVSMTTNTSFFLLFASQIFLRLFCLCLSVQQLERDARLHCSNTSWAVNCVRQAAPQLIHPQAQKLHPCVLCTHEIVCKLTLLYYNGSNKTVCIFHTKLAHKSTQQNTQCSSSECLNVASLRGHVFWLACRFSQNTVAAGNRAPLWSFYILTFFSQFSSS